MMKIILISTCLFLISVKLLSQIQDVVQNIQVKSNNKIYGIYGLYDFMKPNKEVFYSINSLTIKFDSLNKCFVNVNAGNGSSCNYYTYDPNNISFKKCCTTSSSIQCITKSGFKFSMDLFLDTLFVCNRYVEINNEIQLFRDSCYKLTIKPYHDLFPFPIHTNALKYYVKEIKVNANSLKKEFVLINSKLQEDSLGIISQKIDFNINSLVIVRNKNIFEQKNKELRKMSKFYKKQSSDGVFPVSYANVMRDVVSNLFYLDIINTYTRAYHEDKIRTGQYTGFIINKIDNEKLLVKVTYIK